jgi:hypothetical protein
LTGAEDVVDVADGADTLAYQDHDTLFALAGWLVDRRVLAMCL